MQPPYYTTIFHPNTHQIHTIARGYPAKRALLAGYPQAYLWPWGVLCVESLICIICSRHVNIDIRFSRPWCQEVQLHPQSYKTWTDVGYFNPVTVSGFPTALCPCCLSKLAGCLSLGERGGNSCLPVIDLHINPGGWRKNWCDVFRR